VGAGRASTLPLSPARTRHLPLKVTGYARVSTFKQNPDLQVDERTAAGCWQVWTDHASAVLDRRPQLDAVLEQLRPGDTAGPLGYARDDRWAAASV